jgi:hypothetical protein
MSHKIQPQTILNSGMGSGQVDTLSITMYTSHRRLLPEIMVHKDVVMDVNSLLLSLQGGHKSSHNSHFSLPRIDYFIALIQLSQDFPSSSVTHPSHSIQSTNTETSISQSISMNICHIALCQLSRSGKLIHCSFSLRKPKRKKSHRVSSGL